MTNASHKTDATKTIQETVFSYLNGIFVLGSALAFSHTAEASKKRQLKKITPEAIRAVKHHCELMSLIIGNLSYLVSSSDFFMSSKQRSRELGTGKLRVRSQLKLSSLYFPAIVLLVALILVMLNISGSSLALYETSSGKSSDTAGVLLGQPRPVRSDEWLVRTPWLLNQIENDLPRQSIGGMGRHDLALVGDIPVKSLDLLVKPHQIPSVFLGPSESLAAEWWIWHALMMTGMYSLVLVLTRKIGISIFVSILLVASPSTQWWAAPGTFTTVGYGALAAAVLLKSLESESRRKRLALTALAGWLAACLVCTLYVPWIITTTLVVGFICFTNITIGLVKADDLRNELKSTALGIGLFVVTALAFTGFFVWRHLDAIAVINATVYPGARTSESGGGVNTATLFGAPLDFFSGKSNVTVVNETNQSENSSGIIFIIPILVATFGMLAFQKRILRDKNMAVLIATLLAGSALLSWALFPIPTTVGKLLLLDRVPPERVLPALTFAGLIALGQYLCLEIRPESVKEKFVVLSATIVFVIPCVFAANSYRVENMPVNNQVALTLVAIVSCSLLFLLSKYRKVGTIALVMFSTVQFLAVNPLQRGASPLLDNPVSVSAKEINKGLGSDGGWILIGGDVYVRGSLEAAGVSLISGISRYPDYDYWSVLDPELKYEESWNRYGHIFVFPGEKGSQPLITSPQGDVIQVVLDPCDTRLRSLNIKILVTENFELSKCGSVLKTVLWGDRTIRYYAI